jgi:hypothetical protein
MNWVPRLAISLSFVGALLLVSSMSVALAQEGEVTLFDKNAAAVAYVAVADEATIYLWQGRPVAYLKRDGDDVHIYNFDGKHLGWFDRGVIIDHDGNGVGFIKGALSTPTQTEPFKGFKEFKPFRSFEEFAPFRPLRTGYWSAIPLSLFLTN